MTSGRFKIIVLIMTVALLGSVCLQAYWLYNAVVIKQEEFDTKILEILNYETIPAELKDVLTVVPVDSLSLPDSLKGINKIELEKTTRRIIRNEENRVIASASTEIKVLVNGKSSETFTDFSKFSTVNKIVKVLSPLCYYEEGKEDSISSNINEIQTQLGKLGFKITFEKKRDTTILSSIEQSFREQLHKRSIKSDFKIAIYDPATDSLFGKGNEQVSSEIKNTRFRKLLDTYSVIPSREYILISIDSPFQYLYDSLWVQFSLSFLFTVVIIVVFYVTMKEILKQKKLSAIKNDFINNMTHELKTPIATISLAVDTAENSQIINDTDKVRHYLSVIKQENERMNTHVEKVLNIALTEKDSFQLNKQLLDIHELIRKSVNQLGFLVQERNGSIKLLLNAKMANLRVDEFHIGNAILNLLDNAIKYSNGVPEIYVETESNNQKIRICVRDKGIGMKEEEAKKIFEKFYRVPTGNVHNVKGFGLGLSYVFNIVKLHGGEIGVKSETGEGSTFIIELPFE